jgi:hypothetical protein
MAPSFNLPISISITLILATLIAGYAVSLAIYKASAAGLWPAVGLLAG